MVAVRGRLESTIVHVSGSDLTCTLGVLLTWRVVMSADSPDELARLRGVVQKGSPCALLGREFSSATGGGETLVDEVDAIMCLL